MADESADRYQHPAGCASGPRALDGRIERYLGRVRCRSRDWVYSSFHVNGYSLYRPPRNRSANARMAVGLCLNAFEICAVDRQTLEQAALLPGNDFEDNVQIACALIAGLDAIVTRNSADFVAAPVPILTPTEFELLVRLRPQP